MTTFTTIGSGSLAVGKPLTSALAIALRDNPVAMFEGDASAPKLQYAALAAATIAALRPIDHLGTITTTSGASQSLGGLNLAPYQFLELVFSGVSTTSSGSINLGAASNITAALTAAGDTVSGTIRVDLATGLATSMTAETGGSSGVRTGATGFNIVTTSVGVSTSAVFDAGSIRVYGLR